MNNLQSRSLHKPVMLHEMLEYLSPADGDTYIDATFGAGGYSRAVLGAAKCQVYAIDQDPEVQKLAEEISKEYKGRFHLILGNFADMEELLAKHGVNKVNGIVFDIGVSSMQLDQAERGFSFSKEGLLDMRMSSVGKTAAEFIAEVDEQELANIIFKYGDERKSRKIAKAIIEARNKAPITTTTELAEIIRSSAKRYNDNIDPATRTFQAIRIWINNELEALARGLMAAEHLLETEGRLVIITFHSLEDKIVKDFLSSRSSKTKKNKYAKADQKQSKDMFHVLTNKVIKPSGEEIWNNRRARSAKLRAAKRTSAPGKADVSK